ncbi:hypothetical protein DERP_004182 [Dermatophagoides pteronyssinus]|uniref:Uncharacterized protein n=1 Tax=Dermatophagoides pteronyssinus TaxID=6956 RepID=A0ABQ8J920_DERPT|nr:hypothetical protein DERP_004182 [Dermatophagoides pteronyssinus]
MYLILSLDTKLDYYLLATFNDDNLYMYVIYPSYIYAQLYIHNVIDISSRCNDVDDKIFNEPDK